MNNQVNRGFLSISILRGFVFQVIGTILGIVLVMLIRLLVGMPAWNPEPVWVAGALVGVIGFVYGTGVLNDWFRVMNGEDVPEHPTDWYESGWKRYLSISFDHKVIGIQYGVTSMLIFMVAGFFALVFRIGHACKVLITIVGISNSSVCFMITIYQFIQMAIFPFKFDNTISGIFDFGKVAPLIF